MKRIRLPRKKRRTDPNISDTTSTKEKLETLIMLIHETREANFGYFKLFTTIAVAIHGGAIIAILANPNPIYMNIINSFIAGILFSMLMIPIFFAYKKNTVMDYIKNLQQGIDLENIIKKVNKSNKSYEAGLFAYMMFVFVFLFIGINLATDCVNSLVESQNTLFHP